MDWSKAKTYLIIAFAIMNLLLIISILSEDRKVASQDFFTKESIQNLKTLLEEKEIHLESDLPKATKRMGLLKVRYEDIDMERYKQLVEDYPNEIEIVSGKQLRLSTFHNLTSFDKDHALKASNEFIAHYGLGENFSLRNIVEKENSIHVMYDSIYDNMFLEGSYMALVYGKAGDFHMERTRLEVLEKSPKRKLTKTSVEAVMQSSIKMNPGETIDEIKLGYYYEEYTKDPLTKTKTATAFPNWRIRTKSGEFYYIQAFD